MARFLKFRKSAVLPDRAPGGQVRLYLKADETLETVDDEGNREPVGTGEGGGSGIPQGGPLTEPLDADGNRIVGLADPESGQDAVTRAYFWLHDPENLWAAETAFSEGDRIQVGGDGKLFQAGGTGTTGIAEPDWDAVPAHDVVMDGDIEWRYIGFTGEISFDRLGASVPALTPKAAHVADGATVDDLRDALIAAGLMAAS